jgi:hydroxymethylglutaryl-CoA lyase
MDIIIEEQGPRDGFQVEDIFIPTEMKIYFIEQLVEAGLKRIQITSFVNPKLVPQMKDAQQVAEGILKKNGVVYSALVLNLKGIDRAISAGLSHLSISLSASQTHSIKNTGKTIEASKKEFAEMVKLAKTANVTIRAGIQCAFGCRYEGKIDKNAVINLAKHHLDLGVDEISLADSTGMANPNSIRRIMSEVVSLAGNLPPNLHLHDTEGKGMVNMLAAIEVGVKQFDSAFGGLGGCPFIKGATGNIATEDTINLLTELGYQTGIDQSKIIRLSKEMELFLNRKLPSKMKEICKEENLLK